MSHALKTKRRRAEKQFLQTLLVAGQHLGKKAPEPIQRSAATRVMRRLRILSGML
jgi:hypothetical protein